MKILVRMSNWLGDAVMNLPVLTALRSAYPDAHITAHAEMAVSELLQGHPDVNEIIVFERLRGLKAIGWFLGEAMRIRKGKFDRVYILPNSFSSALLPFLAGIPERIGYATDGRFLLLTKPVKRSPELLQEHLVHYYLNILQEHERAYAEPVPRLFASPQATEEVMRLLAECGITADFLICLAPGAAYGPAKRWFPERFAETAKQLAQEYNGNIIITGSSEDIEPAERVASHLETARVCNFAGRTSLQQLMALLQMADMLITNDSGAMHVAAALGTPTVAVFGSTDARVTGPQGYHCMVVQNPVECAPCLKRECPQNFVCMKSVTTEQVVKAGRRLLLEKRGRKE